MYSKKITLLVLFFFLFSIFPMKNVKVLADTLPVPTELTVVATNQYAGPRVNLTWRGSTAALSYNIYRSENGGAFEIIGSSTTASYSDLTAEVDKNYAYKVTAVNGEDESSQTSEVTVKVYEPIWKFDVGNGRAGTVEPGYTELLMTQSNIGDRKPTTLYTDERGYGFTMEGNGRDRALAGFNLVSYDFIFANGNSFKVKLPVGTYSINFICGSSSEDSNGTTNILIDGRQVLSIGHPRGQVNEGFFITSVTKNEPLEMSFTGGAQAKVNGIIITPVAFGPIDVKVDKVDVDSTPAYVDLSWAPAKDALSYNIYRRAVGDNEFTKVGSSIETAYKDNSVVVGRTYSYYVTNVTVNGEGQSATIPDVNVIDPNIAVPAAPEGLAVNREPNSAVLTWTKDESVLFYNIYKKTAAETEYKIIGSVDKSSAATYTDTGLIGSMNYDYQVRAINKGGESEASTVTAQAQVPGVPTPIVVEKAGWTVVELLSTSTDAAIGVKAYRADTIDGEYTELGNAVKAGNAYRYKDLTVDANREYFYKFTAFNYTGESAMTEPVKVTTKEVIAKPAAPEEISLNYITQSGSNYTVRIDWTYSVGATSYKVLRAESPEGPFTQVGTTTHGLFKNTFAGEFNKVYYYKVVAVNVSGDSEDSDVLPVKLTAPARPVATGLKVDGYNVSSSSVNLSWTPVNGALGYNVYRASTAGYDYSLIGTSTSAAYTDTTAEIGVEYVYQVSVVNENGESLKTSAVTVKFVDSSVTAIQGKVTDLAYNYDINDDLKLTWEPAQGAVSYNIYSSVIASKKYSYVGSTSSTEFVDVNSVKTGTRYYKVVPVNNGGEAEDFDAIAVLARTTLKRQMEKLDRGILAVKADNGIFISWRYLGTDPIDISFNVYRDGKKLNSEPIKTSTNYLDPIGTILSKYHVTAVINNVEVETSEVVYPWENSFKDIPLQRPAPGVTKAGEYYEYNANDATVADLDGDGKYEIILNWQPTNAKDNAHGGYTGPTIIDAYKMDGTLLWRINLGINVRSGAHYTHIMAYDFDGDGKAEVAVRTADGTVDGVGNIIGDDRADYTNTNGYILNGPEYLTMFEGTTGKALSTIPYEPQRGDVTGDANEWGDNWGNRVDRFGAAVAYLDGLTPSLIAQRGYYTRMVFAAYSWKDNQFVKEWIFDTSDDEVDPNGLHYSAYRGQGNHSISIGDVDGDGKDELLPGAAVIGSNGRAIHTTRLGHGDANHLSNFDPTRPGLEYFMVQEVSSAPYGYQIRDAYTGEILSGQRTGEDTGRGVAADIDPTHLGAEYWAIRGEWNSPVGGLHNVKGEKISDNIPAANFVIWWDGDLLREILDHNWNGWGGPPSPGTISKWDWENKRVVNLLTAEGTSSNNGTKGNPAIQADLFGDWREEVIWRLADNSALRIYTTTDVTEHRIFTLMHDPIYRLSVAWQNTGYNQPPHTGFYLGHGMETPAQPNISMTRYGEEVVKNYTPQVVLEGTKGSNDWYTSNVTVNVSPYEMSNVNPYAINDETIKTQYSLNGGAWEDYTDSFDITTEGIHNLALRSVGNLGSTIATNNLTVKIDRTSPVINITGVENSKTYTNTEVSIKVDVNGGLLTSVKLNGVDVTLSADKTLNIKEAGQHSLVIKAEDEAGNVTEKTVSFAIRIFNASDYTPKVTLEGTKGNKNWFTSNVKITLKPYEVDTILATTEYSTDGVNWSKYNAAFVLSAEGVTTLHLRSLDEDGQVLATKVIEVKIDKTAPVIDISGVENSKTYTNTEVLIKVDVNDGQLTSLKLNGGNVKLAADKTLKVREVGQHSLVVMAEDEAGNVTEKTISFAIKITNGPSLADFIKESDKKANIIVEVNDSKTVAKEVFDAIKGTNKTVTFTVDGVQWTFNGKDITGVTKDIDLTVKTAKLSESTSPNKDAIAEKVNNKDVFVISFAENGKLPGKATVRVKLSDSWLVGKDINNMYVYYYNSDTNKAEIIAKKLKVDSEGYIEFEVSHNSDYFVADKDLVKAGVLPKTGSTMDMNMLVGIGSLVMILGALVLFKRKRKAE
jgi:LPXTG-motif cell wall-anchored protein